MRARAFLQTLTDRGSLLSRLLILVETERIPFCAIGDFAVNAYADPLVSLDVDIAVAAADLPRLERALGAAGFDVTRFPHSLNIGAAGSDLRVQIQTDPRYSAFVDGAMPREVLGMTLPVARVEDVLQGKVWAAMDAGRRASKRQKDLADIARLLERYPELRERVPAEILDRLL